MDWSKLLDAWPHAPGLAAVCVVSGGFIWAAVTIVRVFAANTEKNRALEAEDRLAERELRREMAHACHASHERLADRFDTALREIRETHGEIKDVLEQTHTHLQDCQETTRAHSRLTQQFLERIGGTQG